MRFTLKRKLIAGGAAVALVAGTGIGAYAYFTAGGSGTGSATTGTAANLTISQVGAGYNSLVAGGSYHQDQTYGGAGITQFGNDITLANPGAQKLVSVVVAMRNWGGSAITQLPMTLSINNGTSGPMSVTQKFDFPSNLPTGRPSVTNVTFNFSAVGGFVQREFVYDIAFDPAFANAGGLNVALSSSANNLSVGTDTTPGTVWLDSSYVGFGNDFPSCTTPVTTGVWEQVITNCGPNNTNNTGAYGTSAQVVAGNADIPAVQVNVVGGTLAPLYPGAAAQPVDYAITNPGTGSVHVNQVTTTVKSVTSASDATIEACATSMYPVVNGGPVNGNIAPGTTVFSPSGTTISMTDDGNNQNNCQGNAVTLGFTSN